MPCTKYVEQPRYLCVDNYVNASIIGLFNDCKIVTIDKFIQNWRFDDIYNIILGVISSHMCYAVTCGDFWAVGNGNTK